MGEFSGMTQDEKSRFMEDILEPLLGPERSETERKKLDARTDAFVLALDDEANDAPTDGRPPEVPRPEEEPAYQQEQSDRE
jgi:hypothetical protein